MEAPKENIITTMENMMKHVSNNKNGKGAIGYSYYLATKVLENEDKAITDNIRLLAIDWVKPTNKTIKDSSYPFTTDYYVVINKNDGKETRARILANHMLSERGQKAVERAGYVPAK